MHKTQLIYPFYTDGYLGSLQVLAYTNRVAMNILVHVFWWTCFSARCIARRELVSHRVGMWLAIIETASFPKCLHQISFPWTGYDSSSYLTSLPTLGIVCFFILAIQAALYCSVQWYSLHFPDDHWSLTPFVYLLDILMILFVKCPCKSFARCSMGFLEFFLVIFRGSLYILDTYLCKQMLTNIFSLTVGCLFILLVLSFA